MTDVDAEAARRALHGRVLYVEDQEINFALIEAMIGAFPNIALVRAMTGWDGVRLARSERPDLMLLDMHLPDIGGLEVVRALNEEIASGQLRVTLLTADTISMDIVKAMSLGAYDYWVKPISMPQLEAGLRRAFGGAPARSRSAGFRLNSE